MGKLSQTKKDDKMKENNKRWTNKNIRWTKKNIARLLLFILVISVLPPLFLGVYAHPSADDYFYGTITYQAWNSTHSLSEVLKASYSQMVERYQNWQGNFTATFLMGLMPAIFSEDCYALTAYLLIITFVVASYYFYSTFFGKLVGADKYETRILTTLFVLLSFQFTYVPSDAFYWFNGGIYYCFYYSLMLILFATYILMIEKRRRFHILLSFLCVMMTLFIGGGNYCTALLTALLLFFFTILFAMKKNKNAILSFVLWISCMSSLLISIFAPGNAIRQASIGENFGAIKAIMISFVYGGYTIAKSTTLCVVFLMFVLLPFLLCIVKKSKLTFRYPIVVLIISFCFYSAHVTPVIYAQGYAIPYRLQNIIYFSYYIFLACNMFYLCGYMERRYRLSETSLMKKIYSSSDKARLTLILTTMMIVAFCIVGRIDVTEGEDGEPTFTNLPLTLEALYIMMEGEAKEYDKQYEERMERLSMSDPKVTLKAFTAKPSLLFHSDLDLNKKHWKNRYVARYYNKKFVVLIEE